MGDVAKRRIRPGPAARQRLYQEAFRLLDRVNHLLAELRVKHERAQQRLETSRREP